MNIKKYLTLPVLFFSLLALPLLALLCSTYWLYGELEILGSMEERMETLQRKQLLFKNRTENEEKLLTQLKAADHFFIDKHLETLVFLQSEMEQLESSDAASSDSVNKWLAQLRGEKNRLRFTEEKRRTQGTLQETEEKQQYPVQMNEEDLKMVLNLIEGWKEDLEGRPQMTIKQLLLTKKQAPSEERVFEVSLDFIKQELHE